ncbi:hypothetical protein DERF_005413 [Dermatophagoides farinae]|uniref:Uncharacterized protein n=1 Tax=Dermatophagoides farinae TaxID=6954 RepID=A0A922L747_DERFA|nr:hypothetical protein DERF_005413 [Dermatophagoides farinae]
MFLCVCICVFQESLSNNQEKNCTTIDNNTKCTSLLAKKNSKRFKSGICKSTFVVIDVDDDEITVKFGLIYSNCLLAC